MSPPRGRTLTPSPTASGISTALSLSTTYSMGTTASAPDGTTPPVAIPIVSPGSSARSAGRDPGDHRESAGRVGRAHGEPVHRRARERGQVQGSRRVRGKYAVRGL